MEFDGVWQVPLPPSGSLLSFHHISSLPLQRPLQGEGWGVSRYLSGLTVHLEP